MKFEDIPTIEEASRRGRRAMPGSKVDAIYGLHQVRGVELLGRTFGSLGFSMGQQTAELIEKRMFPSGSQLAMLRGAAGPSYTTFPDCGPFNYNGTCDEACFGFAPHHMDPFYCATCDEQAADPANNPPWNWHFVGSRGAIQYKDAAGDPCAGKDAWKWAVGACGECAESAVFRCHDGYKKYPENDYWDPTICQGLIACDGTLTSC